MKAQLVNNAIFHGEFDASLQEKESKTQAVELLGKKEVRKLTMDQNEYDKRYF